MTKPLKLLIGSGNLGNAEPDTLSLAAWIPDDGNCSEVLDNQKCPIVVQEEDFETVKVGTHYEGGGEGVELLSNGEQSHNPEQFDIIVVGMQESTFEPKEGKLLDEIKAQLNLEDCVETIEKKPVEDLEVDSEQEDGSDKEDDSDSKEEDFEKAKTTPASEDGSDVEDKEALMSDRSSRVNITDSVQQVAKQAGKAAKTAGKAAGKAGKAAGKAAIQSAEQVAKVGEKVTKQVTKTGEKAARKGVATVSTLTASRDHTKDAAELLADGTVVLHQLIQDRLPSYNRLLSFQRGEMRLLVYSLDRYHSVTVKSVRAQNTGLAGLANKGGIVTELVVDEGTVLSFMACHLEAHEGLSKYATRCSTLGDILKGTKKYAIPSIYPDASLATHFCFVLGDLNFRTRHKGRIKYEEQIEDVNKLVSDRNWKELNEADELRKALEKKECLYGFKTLFCNFMPTFKVERGAGYKYKENRTPSYTDRILWRTGDQLEKKVVPLAYEPIGDYVTSDHKPIRGAFEIQLNRKVFLKKRERQVFRASVFHWRPHDDDAENENLHLFVCDTQCDIFPNSEWSQPPDSYVCIVSSPEDILLKKPSKIKQMTGAMKKFLRLSENKPDNEEQKKKASAGGWPSSTKIKRTHNPDWSNKEIHCVLKTHREDGSPINLTGAMLHIFVFKDNGRQLDEVIGSYPINLENIFRTCTLMGSHSMRTSWRRSVQRKSFSSIRDASDNIVSLDIDGPLLKNGRQTGVIRCTVDAWWITDALARANAGVKDPNDESHSEADPEIQESSGTVFSSRKSTPKKK